MISVNSPKKNSRIPFYFFIILLVAISIILLLFNNLNNLLYSPRLKAHEWCEIHPCITVPFFSYEITIATPTSSIFVFALGFITVYIGYYLIRFENEKFPLDWWGIALIFWGLGALFAGVSYQAFSFHLKCAGRTYCLWTSWFEIVYLMLSMASVDAMVFAQIQTSRNSKLQWGMKCYAFLTFSIYILILVIGSLIPVRFLISFELLVLFLTPTFLLFFIYNLSQYIRTKDKMALILVGTWISLGIIVIVYYSYYLSGITELLWERGIWFSANDVLHIGLILWMIYIGRMIPNTLSNNKSGK